jgi:anti-sigma factor RsiW
VSGCPTHSDLMGGYVLGALEPAEREEMERHLQTCELCRREHAALTGLPGLLDQIEPADVPPPVPSASLEDAVLDRVARERGRRRRALSRLRRPRLALVAAAAAVLAVALVTVLLALSEDDSAYAFGKLRGTPGAGGSFVVDAVPAGTRVSLEVTGLPPRTDYELWCVRTDGRWISGGTFRPRPGGEAEAQLTAAVRPGEYHRVVITGRGADPPKYEPQFLRGKLEY